MRLADKNLVTSMLKDVDTGAWAGHMTHINALYRVSSEEFEGDLNAMKFLHVPFEKESLDGKTCSSPTLETRFGVGWRYVQRQGEGLGGKWARQFDTERAGFQRITYYNEGEDAEFIDKCWGKASSVVLQDCPARPRESRSGSFCGRAERRRCATVR